MSGTPQLSQQICFICAARTGAFVAETVASIGTSCILDFENFSKGKQLSFMTKFFSTLYDKNRSPLMLMLDEAQRYAPQSIKQKGFDASMCLGAIEDLVKLGRKHGLGKMLFTQRGASLNKEVSELCELLVAFRSPGPLDQERIKDWLDANTTKQERDEVMKKLSGLPTGSAVFASGHPNLRTFGVYHVRKPWTFDSSATPKIGESKIEPKKLAKVDLDELRHKMADAIERVKQDDPKELRKTIGELRSELAKKTIAVVPPAPAPAKVKTKEVRVPIISEKDLQRLERAIAAAARAAEQQSKSLHNALERSERSSKMLSAAILEMSNALSSVRRTFASEAGTLVAPAPAPTPIAPPVLMVKGSKPVFSFSNTSTGAPTPTNGAPAPKKSNSDKGLARIMGAVVARDRGQGVSRQELVLVTGFARSTVNRYLTDCASNGWIETAGATQPIYATELGKKTFKDAPAPLEGDARRLQWIADFGASTGEGRIIEFLAQFGEEWVERAAIDEPVSIASSSRNRYLSTLGGPSYRIVETNGSKVRLSPLLFSPKSS